MDYDQLMCASLLRHPLLRACYSMLYIVCYNGHVTAILFMRMRLNLSRDCRVTELLGSFPASAVAVYRVLALSTRTAGYVPFFSM